MALKLFKQLKIISNLNFIKGNSRTKLSKQIYAGFKNSKPAIIIIINFKDCFNKLE